MTDLPKDIKISVGEPEKLVDIYTEWCSQRDANIDEGATCVPIPVADTYITRLMLASAKIPKVVVDLRLGKH